MVDRKDDCRRHMNASSKTAETPEALVNQPFHSHMTATALCLLKLNGDAASTPHTQIFFCHLRGESGASDTSRARDAQTKQMLCRGMSREAEGSQFKSRCGQNVEGVPVAGGGALDIFRALLRYP